MLVGVGLKNKSFEVIDLSSTTSTCAKIANFPLEDDTSFGGLNYQNKPIICQKENQPFDGSQWSHCLIYNEDSWQSYFDYNFPRGFAAMAILAPGELFVSGGSIDGTEISTSEVLTENGWKLVEALTPVPISSHCMAHLNSTTLILVGGRHNMDFDSSYVTYYYNAVDDVWSFGPPINEWRQHHVCGRILKDEGSPEFTAITLGGLGQTGILQSVEILDENEGIWRNGIEFPFPLMYGSLVESPDGGILIVGGNDKQQQGSYHNTIYKLEHAGNGGKWIELPQKLNKPSTRLTSFLIPDELANCIQV